MTWLDWVLSVAGPAMCGLVIHWVFSVSDERRKREPPRGSLPPVDFSI